MAIGLTARGVVAANVAFDTLASLAQHTSFVEHFSLEAEATVALAAGAAVVAARRWLEFALTTANAATSPSAVHAPAWRTDRLIGVSLFGV
jgi:hypothetical protein